MTALPIRWSEAVRAEWGKTWSLRAPWWCVASAVLLTAAVASSLGNDFVLDVRNGHHSAGAVMQVTDALGPAVQLGQLALFALAMVVVTSEYATGTIRSTLLARPQRADVLTGKTVVTGLVGLVAGAALGAAGWASTELALGSHAANTSPAAEVVARVAVTVALGCVLTTAISSVVRSGAGALTVAFVLLVGLSVLSNPVGAYMPAGAATAFVAGDASEYPSWVGALVMLGWAAVAQTAAMVLLSRRDA
ncbi:ABC transporter permease subunit [Streptomyces sp. NPDC021224]|uniref:ABC transporter permease subunit n=1 Tax=unclassified Streptomyces TaxID=2593676 RepID=UPI003798EC67